MHKLIDLSQKRNSKVSSGNRRAIGVGVVPTAGTEVIVSTLPNCDFNHSQTTKAEFDGKTTMGPWANMCEAHFGLFGVGLGTGKGQRLIVREKEETTKDKWEREKNEMQEEK